MTCKAFSTDKFGIFREREIFEAKEEPRGSLAVTVTDERMHEGFQGFGVALTGGSCFLLNNMDAKKRKALLDDIYGENGLGLSVARLSIAASDYSAELYSYEDENGDFSIGKDEAYVLPIIEEVAKNYPSVRFFASPWSPPGRMKTGGSICGGFMREGFIDEYADYILKFVQAYEARGIHLWAITPQNEPETDQGGKMPACYWSPETEAKFAMALRKKADESGLPFEIWLCDHNFVYWKRVLWQLREFPTLRQCIAAVGFHYYDGDVTLVENLQKEYPELAFHFNEGGPRLYDNYATDHCKWGMIMARNLNYGCKSFTGWNLLLDESGCPNVGPFFCGGLVTEHSQTKELSYSGQYRALRHFAPFVRRNCSVLRTSVVGECQQPFAYPRYQKQNIEVCAVRNTDGSVVVNIVNPDADERRQIALCYGGKTYYVDAMPDSLNTILLV